MGRSSFGKRDRDLAKKAKAKAKRERRQAAGDLGVDDPEATEATAASDDGLSTADLLRMIEEVHDLHAAGGISDDDFQTTKADLLGRLSVD
jgi:hypothetical protein